MADLAKKRLRESEEEKEEIEKNLELANRKKQEFQEKYNRTKNELSNVRKKLKKTEELVLANEQIAETPPETERLEIFDITRMSHENDILQAENGRLKKKNDKLKKEKDEKDD